MDAIKQFEELKRLGKDKRLAADGWDEDWKTLISILMSARTKDTTTIPIANELFRRFDSIEKLAGADLEEIEEIIKGVNFYANKSRHVKECAQLLRDNYGGKVPLDFDKLVELPGVGRKTANVFLAVKGFGTIGVDTHVTYISNYLGWTKSEKQEVVENDLKKLFPENYWKDLNWVLVRFGQTYPNWAEKNKLLDGIRRLG